MPVHAQDGGIDRLRHRIITNGPGGHEAATDQAVAAQRQGVLLVEICGHRSIVRRASARLKRLALEICQLM